MQVRLDCTKRKKILRQQRREKQDYTNTSRANAFGRLLVRNYKRAGRLNGGDDVNLSLGLPLYLKGHASLWFNTLPTPDEMSFDELSEELVTHVGSGASEWRVRQALGQRRQLEKESVADYSYSLRTHCARINLPRTEWTHYFVQGLLPEIREYVVLQQPESLEVAENYAKLKESVLATSAKKEEFSPKGSVCADIRGAFKGNRFQGYVTRS